MKYENNVFVDRALKNKNLKGNILFHVVFVHNDTEKWAECEKREFLTTLEEITAYLTKEATAADIPLNIKRKTTELNCNTPPSACPTGLDALLAKENGFETAEDYRESLKTNVSVDDLPIIFVWRQYHGVWEFARPSANSCYVGERTWPSVLLHEILHLFGAKDLYWEPLRDLVQYCFPDSVMNSPGFKLTSKSIDSLTRYLIGWHEKPNAVAEFFLQQTSDISQEQLKTCKMVSKNELVQIYEKVTPFSSFLDLKKAANANNPFASFLMGYCCAHGIYTEQNLQAAEQFYRHSFRGCCFPAGMELAVLLLSKKNPTLNEQAAAQQILCTIEKHHIRAAALLAVCQFTGFGRSKKDIEGALSEVISRYQNYDWANDVRFHKLPKTIQQHKLLEKMSQNLPDLLKSIKADFDLYAEIERNGDPVLFYLMGYFLENGQPRPNPQKALELYLKATNLSLACKAIASCYRRGIGTTVDTLADRLWSKKYMLCREKEDSDPNIRLTVKLLNDYYDRTACDNRQ